MANGLKNSLKNTYADATNKETERKPIYRDSHAFIEDKDEYLSHVNSSDSTKILAILLAHEAHNMTDEKKTALNELDADPKLVESLPEAEILSDMTGAAIGSFLYRNEVNTDSERFEFMDPNDIVADTKKRMSSYENSFKGLNGLSGASKESYLNSIYEKYPDVAFAKGDISGEKYKALTGNDPDKIKALAEKSIEKSYDTYAAFEASTHTKSTVDKDGVSVFEVDEVYREKLRKEIEDENREMISHMPTADVEKLIKAREEEKIKELREKLDYADEIYLGASAVIAPNIITDAMAELDNEDTKHLESSEETQHPESSEEKRDRYNEFDEILGATDESDTYDFA